MQSKCPHALIMCHFMLVFEKHCNIDIIRNSSQFTYKKHRSLSSYLITMLSSSPLLPSAILGINIKTTIPTSSRVRFHPTLAATTTTAAAAAAYSYAFNESTRSTTTTTYLSPHPMASCASLYQILGIPIGASSHEIKTAYRRLARTCHPDVAAIDCKDSSADAFIKIHAAYCTLSDPKKRAVYDQKLFRRNRPLTTVSGLSGYSGRNWETDQCW